MDASPARVECNADAAGWDDYVRSHGGATVFHRRAWSEAVEEVYRHRPLHLTAWSDGRMVGLLPLFLVKSALAGRLLVSVPYGTYGGIVADSGDAARALLGAAEDLCRGQRARYLELRHRDANAFGLPEITRYDTFRKPLPESPGEVLPGLPRKTRTAVRRGRKALGEDAVRFGREGLDTVYDLYARTLRRLGSPNYSRRLFHALADRYGDDCVVLVVRDGDDPLAGVVSFIFRDEIVPYFSGCLEAGFEKRANNVLYVRLMEWAVERGLKGFDFNRTRRDNPGPYNFKRHHGFEPQPLHYQVYLNGGSELPNLSPSNWKYALAGRVWRKLPLWLTCPLGGRVTKWLP